MFVRVPVSARHIVLAALDEAGMSAEADAAREFTDNYCDPAKNAERLRWVELARAQYAMGEKVEFDNDATISDSEGGHQYVLGWALVEGDEDEEDEGEEDEDAPPATPGETPHAGALAAAAIAALREFCGDVEAVGGLERNDEGYASPRGTDGWSDLGKAYINACAALGRTPQWSEDEAFPGAWEPPAAWAEAHAGEDDDEEGGGGEEDDEDGGGEEDGEG